MNKLVSVAALLLVATATLGTALAADQYDLSIDRPAAKAKERAVARITVRPKGAFHVNVDYPVKLKIAAPDGVKLEKDVQSGKEAARFEKTGLDFEVAFTAEGAGTKSFTGEVRFAVCTDTECKPTSEKVSFDVDVK
jgi:hypothetical protein